MGSVAGCFILMPSVLFADVKVYRPRMLERLRKGGGGGGTR
jgi:hypothetical protein